MDQTEALVKTIVEGLQEKKGKNIVTVDLTQLSGSICQYMIICEGSTPTQVSALSDSAWDFAHRRAGEKPLSIDGTQRAEWIGMDYGTVLVHIFLHIWKIKTTCSTKHRRIISKRCSSLIFIGCMDSSL